MKIQKRNGREEEVNLNKLTNRVRALSDGLKIDPIVVAQKVAAELCDGITTSEIDKQMAKICSYLSKYHYDYSVLGGRVIATALHKETKSSFYDTMKDMYKDSLKVDRKTGLERETIVSSRLMDLVRFHGKKLDSILDHDRDFKYDYFAIKTIISKYLYKTASQKTLERPQHAHLKIALSLFGEDFDKVKKYYDLFSLGYGTMATPTLMNSGSVKNQLSSCFLLQIEDDSIDGIYKTLHETALISQSAGGVGFPATNIRAKGSMINSSNNPGTGIIPMLKNFNDTAIYVNQGGKRPGAFAVYLETWHADIIDFLKIRDPETPEAKRCMNLFTAIWMNDLFMERVESGAMWSLMCPDQCPGLVNAFGDEFKALYEIYEAEGRYVRQIPAVELRDLIVKTILKHGRPYIGMKDQANKKSNQKNLGTIKSSNLCIEIMEVADEENTAVCNLASLALPMFVKFDKNKEAYFDFDHLIDTAMDFTEALNRVIDINYYPSEKTKKSNLTSRPIGLGVQGLADVFMMMGMAYDSEEAGELNKKIFEAMYLGSLKKSVMMAREHGPYSRFEGSPASQGLLQYDLWGVTPISKKEEFDKVKEDIAQYGLRNSLLIALMPTATTSQILMNYEAFEPQAENTFMRQTDTGDFMVVNKHLIRDLEAIGLWSVAMADEIVKNKGSIQNIKNIPRAIKDIYKTVYEIKQKVCLQMSADRAPYICQSQSLNLYLPERNPSILASCITHAWKLGLKTACYYTNVPVEIKNTEVATKVEPEKKEPIVDEDGNLECDMCGA